MLKTFHDVFDYVYLQKVCKPVKVKYLLLCTNGNVYLPLTSYTRIMFSKVVTYLIVKIKSFVKYLKNSLDF